MEKIVCPKCQKVGQIELRVFSRKLRCPCGEEFIPLLYVPRNDIPEAAGHLDARVVRGTGYFAVGYTYRSWRFVVVRGSRFLANPADLSADAARHRNSLIAGGALRFWPDENGFIAEGDIQFDNSILALSVIAGGSTVDLAWEIPSLPNSPIRDEFSYRYRKVPHSHWVRDKLSPPSREDTHSLRAASPQKVVEPAPQKIVEAAPAEDAPKITSTVDNGPRPDFLALDTELLRSLIVTVLERRPNNSVKRDDLVKEVLKEIDVRTSGAPRERFEKRLLGQVRWLSDRNVVEEYRSKNRRIKLTDEYRGLVLARRRETSGSDLVVSSEMSGGNATWVDPYAMKSLQEQNLRLRKMVLLLSQELGLGLELID